MLELLLSKGASVDVRDKGGRTPLMLASVNGHVDIARMLLSASAVACATSAGGMNAAHYASAGGHAGVLRLLFEHDSSLDEAITATKRWERRT